MCLCAGYPFAVGLEGYQQDYCTTTKPPLDGTFKFKDTPGPLPPLEVEAYDGIANAGVPQIGRWRWCDPQKSDPGCALAPSGHEFDTDPHSKVVNARFSHFLIYSGKRPSEQLQVCYQ